MALMSTEKKIRANSRLEWWLRALFLGTFRPKEYKKDRVLFTVFAVLGLIRLGFVVNQVVESIREEKELEQKERDEVEAWELPYEDAEADYEQKRQDLMSLKVKARDLEAKGSIYMADQVRAEIDDLEQDLISHPYNF